MDEPFVYFAVFQIYQTTFPPKGSKSGGENNYGLSLFYTLVWDTWLYPR